VLHVPTLIQFAVRGVPKPKGSMKAFMPKGARFPVITHDNPKTRPWVSSVRIQAQQHAPKALWLGPISLELLFTIPKPQSLPKRRPSWAIRKPDLDKLIRSVKDALSGVIYKDDAQVIYESAKKEYGNAPGVEVVIRQVSQDLSMKGKDNA